VLVKSRRRGETAPTVTAPWFYLCACFRFVYKPGGGSNGPILEPISREINRLNPNPGEPRCLPNTGAMPRAPPVHPKPSQGSHWYHAASRSRWYLGTGSHGPFGVTGVREENTLGACRKAG